MRPLHLSLAFMLLALAVPLPAGASGPSDPCGFLTRRNLERCLGTVLVKTGAADDEVVLDGTTLGKGTLLIHELAPGRHVVELRPATGAPAIYPLAVRRGQVQVLATRGGRGHAPLPALSEVFFGFTDECDSTYVRNEHPSLLAVDADRLATLRGDRRLARSLPPLPAPER